MVEKIKEIKRINKFLILVIFIGIVLTFDGFVSILLQPEQNYIFQSGRTVRIIMGVILILIGNMLIIKGKKGW